MLFNNYIFEASVCKQEIANDGALWENSPSGAKGEYFRLSTVKLCTYSRLQNINLLLFSECVYANEKHLFDIQEKKRLRKPVSDKNKPDTSQRTVSCLTRCYAMLQIIVVCQCVF